MSVQQYVETILRIKKISKIQWDSATPTVQHFLIGICWCGLCVCVWEIFGVTLKNRGHDHDREEWKINFNSISYCKINNI